MLTRCLVFGLVLFVVGSMESSGQGFDQFSNAYLSDLELKHASVFVAQCHLPGALRKGSEHSDYRATLLVGLAGRTGLLVESEGEVIVNLATISFAKSGPKLVETNGGVYSYARVINLLKELSGHTFKLLSPFTRQKFAKLRVTERCKASSVD